MQRDDLLQAIFKHPAIGLARIDLDGRIVATNSAVEAMLGQTGEELRGRALLELASGGLAWDDDPIASLVHGNETLYEKDRRFTRPDGSEIWASVNLSLVRAEDGTPEYALAHLQDVTLRKLAEEELREERENIERLWTEADSGIAIVDERGRMLRVYPGFTRMFGYTEEEAAGRTLQELVVPEDRHDESLASFYSALAGNTISAEVVRRHKDGRLLDVSALGRAMKLPGGRTGVFVLFRDISDRKRAEAALERLATTDDLTGLWNRRGFQTRASDELVRARRVGSRVILFYIDIDDFKAVNDTHGHAEGDRVLANIAQLLRESCRGSDVVARLGGDEFVVLALDGTGEGERLIHARIEAALDRLNSSGEHPIPIGLTVGAAVRVADDELDLQALLVEADQRMYDRRAKTESREETTPPAR